jgi:hypothetical protein
MKSRRNYSIVKLDALSEICRDAGQVFLASFFIEPMLSKIANPSLSFIGLSLVCFSWSLGLSLSRS